MTMKEVIRYMVCVVAVSFVINDLPAIPRWSASTPQIDVNVNETINALENGIDFKQDAFANAPPEVREIMRAYQNGQGALPISPEAALNDASCRQLDYEQSYLHDFNDRVAGLCNQSPESRANCYLDALKEYLGGLPKGTVLNVDGEHNLKIVCDDGREYVFDKDGKIIPDGINEGTFNISNPDEWVSHTVNDIIAAIERLPNKSSMTKDECIKLLKDYQEQVQVQDNFSIDTSKIESLTGKMIALAQSLLDAGKKASNSQISTYNSYASEARQEMVRLLRPILALQVSDAKKKKIFKEKIENKLKPLVDRHQLLQKELVSRGLVGGLQPMSLDDLRSLETGQSGGNDSSCGCDNPECKAAIPAAGPGWATCAKCGKLLGTIVNGRLISNNPAVNGRIIDVH